MENENKKQIKTAEDALNYIISYANNYITMPPLDGDYPSLTYQGLERVINYGGMQMVVLELRKVLYEQKLPIVLEKFEKAFSDDYRPIKNYVSDLDRVYKKLCIIQYDNTRVLNLDENDLKLIKGILKVYGNYSKPKEQAVFTLTMRLYDEICKHELLKEV